MPAPVPVYVDVIIPEIMEGTFEIEGVLNFADQTVTFEYRTRNAKAQWAEVETFQLHLDQLRAIELKGIWGATIIMHPRRLSTFEYVPGAGRQEIVFKVKHKHRQQAAALVSQLQRALSDRGGVDVSRLPFQLPDANLGITEIKGVVYLDEAYLVLEVRSGVTGGTKKKQQVIKVEPGALEEVQFNRGAFRDQLYLKPKKRDLLRAMPGMYKNKEALKLKIPKRYRAQAEHLVDEIRRLQV